jgi:hypothetical protein
MQDTGLFLSLAEIAGVFVGFGALIAVRSGGAGEPQEVAPMRLVVGMGMLTIIAGLAPVTLGRYGLTDHQVLALSSVLVAVAFAGLAFAQLRTPEYRAARAIVMPTHPTVQTALENVAWLLIGGGSPSPWSPSCWAWHRTSRRPSTSRSSCSSWSWPRGPSCGSSSWSDAPRARDEHRATPASSGTGDRRAYMTDASGQRAQGRPRLLSYAEGCVTAGGGGSCRMSSCSFRWPRSPACPSASGRSSASGAVARWMHTR